MLSLTTAQRYFIYRGITDMRKGVDGLCGLIRNEFRADPLSGDVFIFFNKNKCVVKLVCWDQDGFCMYYKRLEKGTFELPSFNTSDNQIPVPVSIITCIMQGINLSSIKKRKRYMKAA